MSYHEQAYTYADAGAVEASANVATSWAQSDQLHKNALPGDQTAEGISFW